METQKVIVENWPKPKRGWHGFVVLIAFFALFVSVYSVWLTRKELVFAHRPYVYVSSRKIDERTMDVKSVLLRCLNTPAKIIKQEFYYVVVKTKGNSEEEFTETIPLRPTYTASVLYPSEKTSWQVFFPLDFKKEILADPNNVKLKRKVKIDYKELSSSRTYYFEGNWDYNKQYNIWESADMFGN